METQDSAHKNFDDQMTAAQLEKLRFEINKLKAEIESLISTNRWENRITRYIPVITVLIAVASFWFGIYQFTQQQRSEFERLNQQQNIEIQRLRDEFANNIQLSEKEFRRKFYEKQLDIYFDLSKTAAQISTIDDPNEMQKLHQHFLELYNGNLNIVQDQQVMKAASEFEQSFVDYKNNQGNRDKIQSTSRALAEACRNSFRDVWNIPYLSK